MDHKPNILIVGSFVMDHFATTRVFPREGETVLGVSSKKAPGGKGANQAVQAARLGANVTMVGKLGRDSNAETMIETCRAAGIHTEHFLFDDAADTGCSFIILEQKPDGSTANRILVIPGANMTIRPDEIAFLKDSIGQYDFVILQLEIPMEINEIVCRYAAGAGVPVMLNPAPSDVLSEEILHRLAYISPNEHEAQNMTGIPIPVQPDDRMLIKARESAEHLRAQGAKNVIITLGENGAVNLSEKDFRYSPCVPDTHAIDPTAAGDSFVASFCCGICVGLDAEDALCFANHAASLTVSRLGAMPSLPTLDEVIDHLKSHGKSFSRLDTLRG